MKTWYRFLLLICLTVTLGYVLIRSAWQMREDHRPDPTQVAALRELGKVAIASGDVPVAALLLYDGEVIGRGSNTVLRDDNAGGHAEINAVSDAMRNLGRPEFQSLDKDRLLLVSTFEPCMMCKGMMLEYGIRHVAFEQRKGLWHWFRQDLRALRFEFEKRGSGPDGLQDSLFQLHPAFER